MQKIYQKQEIQKNINQENNEKMMKEHNDNMNQIKEQMKKEDINHLNIMNDLEKIRENEKRKNMEELNKENIKFQERRKILEEKQKEIYENNEMIKKSIKEDFQQYLKNHEKIMKEMEMRGEQRSALYKSKIQNIEMNIRKMENELNEEINSIKKDSERIIQEMEEINKKKLENLDNEFRLKFEQLEQQHQMRINQNNYRMNQLLMAYQNNIRQNFQNFYN